MSCCTIIMSIVTEEGRPLVWIGSPSGRHQGDEGVSAGDVGGQAVQADLGTYPIQHAEHDLHGVGHVCRSKHKHTFRYISAIPDSI